MTRKRYIKLLMALGMPRNVAAQDARDCQRQGLEYHKELVRLRRFLLFIWGTDPGAPRNFMEVLPYE